MRTELSSTVGRWVIVCLCAVALSVTAYGVLPGSEENFDDGAGWELYDVLNWNASPVTASGSVRIIFPKLNFSVTPQEKCLRATASSSGGAFVGDYYGSGISAVRFKLLAEDMQPSFVRVWMHSSSPEGWWYTDISGSSVPVGEWTDYEVPLTFSTGWRQGVGDTVQGFHATLANIDWMGVSLGRAPSGSRQDYYLDDVGIDGAPATAAISGTAVYTGEQSGSIRVVSSTSKYSWSPAHSAVASVSGAYAIGGVPTLANYWVKAYLDANANSTYEFWEAVGWNSQASPLDRLLGDVGGVNMVLSDPMSADGLPYWWLHEHFDVDSPDGAGGEVTASGSDNDNDGSSNYDEYRAGTNPNDASSSFAANVNAAGQVEVSWPYLAGRTYTVWHTEDLSKDFTAVASGIASDSYVHAGASGLGPHFYQVEIDGD
jgi:hypothetical protein